MLRPSGLLFVCIAFGSLFPQEASAETFILYLHGRGSQNWERPVSRVPGWTNVTLSYDGNARLDDASTSGRVLSVFERFCTGDNACVVNCHSAGCMRTLFAMDALRAKGATPQVLWVEAAGSAAGGTRLAEISTSLIWVDEPIDEDLRRDRARAGTGWGHIQDAMRSSVMYHLAGRKDACRWFGCGNWLLPAGVCDGLVCLDSAGGASEQGGHTDGCAMAKYPGRVYDAENGSCNGAPFNHDTVANEAVEVVTRRLRGTAR